MGSSASTITLNRITLDALEYFIRNDKSNVDCKEGELFMEDCQITNVNLNEIIVKWFINKNLLNKIKLLRLVSLLF